MLDLLRDIVDLADGACSYAEARHEERMSEEITVRNGAVEQADSGTSEGIGIRVRVGGASRGFAATRDVSRDGAREALSRALDVARAQPAVDAVALTHATPAEGHWAAPCAIDPFTVPWRTNWRCCTPPRMRWAMTRAWPAGRRPQRGPHA